MKRNIHRIIHRSFSSAGKLSLIGDFFYEGMLFRLSGTESLSPNGFAKAKLSVISLKTGKPLQLSGTKRDTVVAELNELEKKALEADISIDKLEVSTIVDFPIDDANDMEKRLNKAIEELYDYHYDVIISAYREFLGPNCRQYISLYHAYHRDFIRSLNDYPCELEKKDEKLMSLCLRLDRVLPSQNKVKEILSYFENNEIEAEKELQFAASFIEYCRVHGFFTGFNPFTAIEGEITGNPDKP